MKSSTSDHTWRRIERVEDIAFMSTNTLLLKFRGKGQPPAKLPEPNDHYSIFSVHDSTLEGTGGELNKLLSQSQEGSATGTISRSALHTHFLDMVEEGNWWYRPALV